MSSNATPFSQELADSLYNSTDQFPVDFELAWQWLAYSRKDNAKLNFKKCGFIESVDFNLLNVQEVRLEGARTITRMVEIITLTVDCFKMWGMMANTPQGKKVRIYFLDCERRAQEKQAKVLTPAEQNLHNAQLLLDHERRTLALEQQIELHADQLASYKERLERVEAEVNQRGNTPRGFGYNGSFYEYPS